MLSIQSNSGSKRLNMNYCAGPWDYVENLQSPWRTPHRSPPHTQKQNPNMSWQTRSSRCGFRAQTPTISLRVLCGFLCTELATRGSSLSRHVGVLFLSVGWGSVRGSSRRLQVFYVIPGSRVIVHIYSPTSASSMSSSSSTSSARTCANGLGHISYSRNGYFSRICSAWPKSHRRNGTRDEHKHLDQYMKSKCVRIPLRNI